MTQAEARAKAEELGGIAVEARWKQDDTGGHWLLGGWPNQPGSTWIVTDLLKREVFAD
jgi:hypothetical protein